jgi:hypothetical protein
VGEGETSATAEERVAQPTGSTSVAPNVKPGCSTSATPAAQLTTVKECESSSKAEARVVQPRGSTSTTPNVQPRGSTSITHAAQDGGSRSILTSVAQPEG